MINDIFNKANEITVNKRVYKLEYDNAAYIELEQKLKKGTFELCGKVLDSTIGIKECLQIALCGLQKHQVKDEIDELEEIFIQNPYLLVQNIAIISAAFIKPLMPPDIINKGIQQEVQTTEKK